MALRDPHSELSVLEKVGKALEATLGVEDLDVTQPYSFAELGGDSLGAAAFSALLSDIFGVDVPVNTILSPAGNPRQWARAIEAALDDSQRARRRSPGSTAKVPASSTPRTSTSSTSSTARVLDHPPMEEPPAESRTVLLTGANGFLGRFLCLEWLERVATDRRQGHLPDPRRRPRGGRLAGSPPRSSGDAVARAALPRSSPQDHLEVVVGDVAEPRLGVDDATYDRLAREVDRIVHPGGARQPHARLRVPVRSERRRHGRAGGLGARRTARSASTSCRRWPRRGWWSAAGASTRTRRCARRSLSATTTAPGTRPASGPPSTCCTAPTAASACR